MKPGTVPHLFDTPDFFDKIAERSQLSGQSPDLLFFAFYYQPVSLIVVRVDGFVPEGRVQRAMQETAHATECVLPQGTLQQRYAAAALQRLNWYYTPQTKRWYKAINAPPTVDSFGRVGTGRPSQCVLQAQTHPYKM